MTAGRLQSSAVATLKIARSPQAHPANGADHWVLLPRHYGAVAVALRLPRGLGQAAIFNVASCTGGRPCSGLDMPCHRLGCITSARAGPGVQLGRQARGCSSSGASSQVRRQHCPTLLKQPPLYQPRDDALHHPLAVSTCKGVTNAGQAGPCSMQPAASHGALTLVPWCPCALVLLACHPAGRTWMWT